MARPLRARPLPRRQEILPATHEDRMRVIRKYARPNHRGRPMRCMPSPFDAEEQELQQKFVYDSEEIALQCAAELRTLGGPRLWVYPCHRSKHGHVHLTSKHPRGERS